MKKVIVSLLSALCFSASAQVNVLEFEDAIIVPPFGPSVAPITVPFSLDVLNDNTFTVPTNNLTATFSIENQVFTTTAYPNISNGLNFGGFPTLSTFASATEQAEPSIPYALLGYYTQPPGGPKSFMFTSDPYATPAQYGTGLDAEGEGNAGYSGGIQLFTAAQLMYDQQIKIDTTVYFGDLVITFSQPVKDPVIHLAGIGGSYSYLPFGLPNLTANYRRTFFTTELEMVNTGLTSTILSGNPILSLAGNNVENNYVAPNGGSEFDPTFFPLDNYGAATGSIRINGTVQTLTYKVYLKGSPNSTAGMAWSGEGLDSNGNEVVTGALHDPFSGDVWYAALSLRNPYQQLSGNVFVDADSLVDGSIATTTGIANDKTNGAGTLYANLLNTSGDVVAVTPVSSDGIYLFDSVAVGSYTVQLTTIPGVVNSPAPPTTLPTNWINTGEFNGAGPGSDGNTNGRSASVNMPLGGEVTNVNFGIEQEPNSDPKSQVIPAPVTGVIPQGTATNNVTGSDPEQGALLATSPIVVTGLPTNATVFYNSVPLFPGQVIPNFDPTLLSYTGITPGSISVIFNYAFKDAADVVDKTPAPYTLSWNWPLTVQSVVLNGSISSMSNDLAIRLNTVLTETEAVVLYRQINTNAEEIIKTFPVSGNDIAYQDADVTSNNAYTYYAVATSKNGTTQKSNVVILNRMGENDVVVYPNPATSTVTVMFSEILAADAYVNVFNAEGKLVNKFTIGAGSKSQQVDISQYASGKYVIQITHNDKVKVVKFIKE
jgi:hypothetical protein